MLYKLHIGNVYHSKWLLCIKDILNSCGYLELWNNQVVESNFNLAKKVKQCRMDDFVNNWKELIFNSSKCLNYRTYKTEFGFEKYLVTLPYDLANVLCTFRCGSHRLPIECGRSFGNDRDERLCDLCDHSELGDEFHYLYNCTFFAEKRKTYLPRNLLQVRNVISFNSLMNSDDIFVLID